VIRPLHATVIALSLAALLGGCQDSHQYDDVRPYMQPGSGPQPIAAAPAEIEAEGDPIKPKDKLDGGMDMPPDPLVADDPLSISKDVFEADVDNSPPRDPLATTDVVMPTKHTHWLRGSVVDAAVSVSVNNVKLGDFYATVDKDITMRCRKGYNTVTFTYIPIAKTSFAALNVLESEHNPPIAPLATFDSKVDAPAPDSASSSDADKPVRQTFEFYAN
jgi:hypothetical protein